jgi:predicted  nucleic acid-binding Zn-ribbon protein
VQKIDVTIAKLRLLLADVTAKEAQYTAVRQQFRDQLRKAVEYSIYGDSSLDGTLGLMAEIQQRITDAEGTLRDLDLIRKRAERELESLTLTRRIEAAKTELQQLLNRQTELEEAGSDGAEREELGAQIRELRQQINEASEQAARTLGRR